MPSEPSTHARARVTRAMLVALLIQLAIPLGYYLRDDPYDERFAWRMFSAVRATRCRVRASESRGDTHVPLQLERLTHAAWQRHFERQRVPVITRFLEARCEAGATRATLTSHCVDARGAATPERRFELDCETGALALGEAR